MCVIERDGKVVIIDQATEIERLNAVIDSCHEDLNCKSDRIDELEAGLEEAVKVVRQNAGTISALRAKIAALEVEVKRLSETNACDDWGNPVVLGVAGGSNDKL